MFRRLIPRLAWSLGVSCLGVALAGEPPEVFDYGTFLNEIRVPPDFTLEHVAGVPEIRFPMFACFDDIGRLYVAESSGKDLYAGLKRLTRDCRVSVLEDLDQDGRFEKATVFADHVTFPMGLAWNQGRLYVADPPELAAFTDTDGDGRADKRERVLSGFGHTDNGSLHGLAFGPDGLLYFTMGEPDGWKLPRGDGSFLQGVAGALFRCRPDGSNPEVISRGFVNLVEVEFMAGGEQIATDNWFQMPSGGFRDALVDCAPGGLYPYIADRGTPLPRTGITLPSVKLLPAVAHSGLVRPKGRALPASWSESLFSAEHNTRKVVRHALLRAGSTFTSTVTDLLVGDTPDFHPSDLLEDADGSLIVVDTGGWYVEHCPTGRIRNSRSPGGIYRLRWKQAQRPNDPWGRLLSWKSEGSTELGRRFRDPRIKVAARAEEALVQRADIAALAEALGPGEQRSIRLRALWALSRIPGDQALAWIRNQLGSDDADMACAAARSVALRHDLRSAEALITLLDAPAPAVRRAAAESLARCGARTHAPRLVAALVKAEDSFEEHACILALHALAEEPFVRTLLRHGTHRVRRAALHLLDQPPFSTLAFDDLLAPLADSDPTLRAAAGGLLQRHPEWAERALPWLRARLLRPGRDETSSGALGELIKAFQRQTGMRNMISELLDPASSAPDATRAFLFRILPELSAQKPEPEWLRAIPSALSNAVLRASALATIRAYPRAEWAPALTSIANDPGIPAEDRLLAARASTPPLLLSDPVFTLATTSMESGAAASHRLAAIDLLAHASLSRDQLRRLLKTMETDRTVSLEQLMPAFRRAVEPETQPAVAALLEARLKAGWIPSRSTLEQALAFFPERSGIREALEKSWETHNAGSLQRLRDFSALLTGGNVDRGREVFSKATCSGCHRVGEQGGLAGPDLTRVGAIRSGADLLESILFPSSSIAQGYEPYQVTTKDGEDISGSLAAQDPEGVTVRDGTGSTRRIPAARIASLERRDISVMPEGLELSMTADEFRDLLAYLQGLR